jgi:hypothetical protein
VLGTFVLIGPYVGGLLIWSILAINSFGGLAGRPSLTDILAFPLTGLMGYPFGALPAAATGLLLGLVSAHIRSKAVWILLAIAVGALASMLMLGAVWMFALTGAGAALVAALVAVHVRPRWSN